VTLLQKRPCHGDRGARIFAAISMLAFVRVGGRTLPLDLAPEATGVGVGGRIGSIGASRDSVWNRRDDSGVRP
jgi:hypothetical protein